MTNENITVNMENLSTEEREQLLALIKKANAPKVKPDTRWKPELGEEYWFINDTGNVYQEDDDYTGCLVDMYRFEIGNCFKTEKEAVFVRERFKVLRELRRFASDKNGGIHVPYFLYCDPCTGSSIHVGKCSTYTGELRFRTEQDAKAAIKAVGEDRIKKYYFMMED